MLKVAVCAAYDRHPASQNREISFRLGLRHKRRVASFGYLARHSFPPFVIHRPLLDGCYLVIWVGIFLLNRGFHPIYVDLRGTVSFPPYFQRKSMAKSKALLFICFHYVHEATQSLSRERLFVKVNNPPQLLPTRDRTQDINVNHTCSAAVVFFGYSLSPAKQEKQHVCVRELPKSCRGTASRDVFSGP
jgi:hypothetical protein